MLIFRLLLGPASALVLAASCGIDVDTALRAVERCGRGSGRCGPRAKRAVARWDRARTGGTGECRGGVEGSPGTVKWGTQREHLRECRIRLLIVALSAQPVRWCCCCVAR
jgi:hypothetical protein